MCSILRAIFVLFSALLALPALCHAEFVGRVVGVSDGDTVTVLAPDNVQYRIRLAGIDAPEKAQPFGARSKETLSSLVFGHWVTVEGDKRDRYGRTVAKLWVAPLEAGCRSSSTCPRTVDANLAQVATGMAWWYRQYAREQAPEDRIQYAEAEASARNRKVGLWRDPDPVPPWEWRRERRLSMPSPP